MRLQDGRERGKREDRVWTRGDGGTKQKIWILCTISFFSVDGGAVTSRLDSLSQLATARPPPWRLLSKGPLSLSPTRMRILVGRRASHPCRRPWLRLQKATHPGLTPTWVFPRRVEQMQAFIQWHVISRTLPGLLSTEVAFRRLLFLLLLGPEGEKARGRRQQKTS